MNNKNSLVLVTGGTGYLGSHTVVELMNQGYDVLIADNLSNSYAEVVDFIEQIAGKRPGFVAVDLADCDAARAFFAGVGKIDAIIHFAALKAVNESVQNPLLYFRNNLFSLINLLENMHGHNIRSLVFSSSCTVYGQPDILPVSENCPFGKAWSPYGRTKQISEHIIEDSCKKENLNAVSLRYFNPIGAHPSALIGEYPIGTPGNLMPFITQTAAGIQKILHVFGSDYDTPDGTAIRDYIHVMDLANAHIAALEHLLHKKNKESCEVYNIGAGRGYSVLEVIESFEKVSGQKLNYEFAPRRKGDIVKIWADVTRANKELQWCVSRSLDEMTLSAWKWQLTLESRRK